MRKIPRIFSWNWKERSKKKDTLLSHSYPLPTNKLRVQWEKYNVNYPDPPIDPIVKKLLPLQLDLYFVDEVMGRSHILITVQSNPKSIWEALLIFLVFPFYFNLIQNYQSRLEEFSFYLEGESSLSSYQSFQGLKKFTLFPAKRFQLRETYYKTGYLEYTEACFLLPANYQPATSFQGRSRIIKIQSIIHSIDYGIWQEEIDSPNSVWLMDVFLEVRTLYPFADTRPIYRYMGSQYSHEEIAIHCSQVRVKRLHYPTKLILSSPQVFHSSYGKGESKEFSPRIQKSFSETRIGLPESSTSYQEISLQDQKIINHWQGGVYELDINRIDLPPLF